MYIITGGACFGGKKKESTPGNASFCLPSFIGGDCQDQPCEPHPLRFPIPFPFHWDAAPTHSAEKQHRCGNISREWSSRGEPSFSWPEPKGAESSHVEQGGAFGSVGATWIWIGRVQCSGKWAVQDRKYRFFGICPSLFAIVSGPEMGMPAARRTLHLVFVWETIWCCSQEQLPPYFCPSSHMELSWAVEHLLVCEASFIFINIAAITVLFFINFFFLLVNCYLNP